MKSSFQSLIPFLSLVCDCQVWRPTQFNYSAPRLISWQAGVSKLHLILLKSKSHCDWRSVSHKSWCRATSGAHDQIFITVSQLRSCFCVAPSLTLYMLLALASAVFLGSESHGTRDHILLSQIWDFPFRHLLRLAGSRWRYSTPPPHREIW
jgi:hypothetical protein